MTKPHKALVSKKRVVHMYSELWHASRCVLDAGVREPQGSSWQFLSSTVLTAFAFEAYLNHVGPSVISCWRQLERLPPWAKFELICETLKVRFTENSGERPLQTIVKLLEFRNTMAHGRSGEIKQKYEKRDVNDQLDSYLGQRPLADWEQLIKTDAFAKRVREDVEAVLEKLHKARPAPKEGLFCFGIGTHRAQLI
ncbi:MAG: hypothetical protein Q8L89_04640 [Gammaproteobacteria bacterium]|nr:hypothetical protein [Gammaproteobacteria bacterium]